MYIKSGLLIFTPHYHRIIVLKAPNTVVPKLSHGTSPHGRRCLRAFFHTSSSPNVGVSKPQPAGQIWPATRLHLAWCILLHLARSGPCNPPEVKKAVPWNIHVDLTCGTRRALRVIAAEPGRSRAATWNQVCGVSCSSFF